MNYWIFQSKKERFDLSDPSNLKVGKSDDWIATRYRSKMMPGDLVYFWMGGPQDIRGIYGWGLLSSKPTSKGKGHSVEVVYKCHLKEHITVSRIKELKIAQYLMILNISIGTNFLINKEEALSISTLFPPNDNPFKK